MSSAETLTPEVDDPGLPSFEEIEAMHEAMKVAELRQPTLKLLASPAAYWDGLESPGRHLVTFEPDLPGVIDVPGQLFIPDDYAQLTALLQPRLTALLAAPLDGGTRQHVADWPTLAPIEPADELDGTLTLAVRSLPDEAGVIYQLDVRLDAELNATVVAENPIGGNVEAVVEASAQALAETLAEAEAFAEQAITEPHGAQVDELPEGVMITATYLEDEYGSTFEFDGRTFTVDWDTWNPDEPTDEGMVGSEVAASTDGGAYTVYVWYIPRSGVHVVRAEVDELAGVADLFEKDGVDADYLREHFDDDLPYGNRTLRIDWDTWRRTTSDGDTIHFTATAVDAEHDERHDVEGEFAVEELELTLTSGPEDHDELAGVSELFDEDDDAGDKPDEEPDLDAEFEQLKADLSTKWGASHTLSFESREYRIDLSDFERDGEDDDFWYVNAKATAAGGWAGTCRLKIRDAEDLAIQSVSD